MFKYFNFKNLFVVYFKVLNLKMIISSIVLESNCRLSQSWRILDNQFNFRLQNHSSFVEAKLYKIQLFICEWSLCHSSDAHASTRISSTKTGNEIRHSVLRLWTSPYSILVCCSVQLCRSDSLLEFINEVIPLEKLTLFYMKWKRKLDLLESSLWKSPGKMDFILQLATPLLFQMMSNLLNLLSSWHVFSIRNRPSLFTIYISRLRSLVGIPLSRWLIGK